MQGGASTQFSALPLNFAAEGATVDYVVTGAWGAKCVTHSEIRAVTAYVCVESRTFAGLRRKPPSTTR